MSKKDCLGDRMKEYENISRNYLTKKIPVIIRLDGKAFHSFTKGFIRPFDSLFIQTMQETMKYLCENIQGCVFGYCQSDEITLVLTDYATIKTDAWFGYNIQKMASISASMATLAFNKAFENKVEWFRIKNKLNGIKDADTTEWNVYIKYLQAVEKGAMFDARCFSIPKEEVANCLIWRQQDCTRNSIQSVGQANFPQKALNKKSCNNIQDMLMLEKGINWNDFSTVEKRGTCCIKQLVEVGQVSSMELEPTNEPIYRNKWILDTEIPIFTQDRNYIEQYL